MAWFRLVSRGIARVANPASSPRAIRTTDAAGSTREPEGRVDADRARPAEADRRGADAEHQRELEARLAVEEAVGPVDLADDHDRLGDEHGRHDRRQEPDGEHQAAEQLDVGGDQREQPGGPEAHVGHRAFPAGEARAAPPAEHLLGAVHGERQPDTELEDE